MDLDKYRNLFLEEATEHLVEMSRALLALEKDPRSGNDLEAVFRMAHSIKGMAASLGYDSINELAHRLEDRMGSYRSAGEVDGPGLPLLFRALDALERMVSGVRDAGSAPLADRELLAELGAAAAASGAPPRRKASPAGVGTASPRSPAPPPPPSVRVRTETIDRFLASVGEVILTTEQLRTAAGATGRAARLTSGFDRMDRVVGELQRRALDLRTTPLLRVMENLPRLARDLAERGGKRVAAELRGVELELDRAILDRLYDPLVHLVRNAVDHGIETPQARRAAGKPETGALAIHAARDRDAIRIDVRDDGAGVDLDAVRTRAVEAGWIHPDLAEDLPADELAAFVFRPGLSTAARVSEISGRGVGMDAVRATIESLGGHVELASRRGVGTTTTLVVPIAAAVQRVLLVGIAEELVAVPIAKVERIVEIDPAALERSGGECFTLLDDEPVLVLELGQRLGWGAAPPEGPIPLLLTEVRGARVALRVERLAGQQAIYVKPLPPLLARLRGLAGLTLLGDGRPVFVLDLNHLP